MEKSLSPPPTTTTITTGQVFPDLSCLTREDPRCCGRTGYTVRASACCGRQPAPSENRWPVPRRSDSVCCRRPVRARLGLQIDVTQPRIATLRGNKLFLSCFFFFLFCETISEYLI